LNNEVNGEEECKTTRTIEPLAPGLKMLQRAHSP
jgi:hypothetical protein